MKGLFK